MQHDYFVCVCEDCAHVLWHVFCAFAAVYFFAVLFASVFAACTVVCGCHFGSRTFLLDTSLFSKFLNSGHPWHSRVCVSTWQIAVLTSCGAQLIARVICAIEGTDFPSRRPFLWLGQCGQAFRITVKADHNCGKKSQLCGETLCPVSCTGLFTAWGDCCSSCGGGSQLN